MDDPGEGPSSLALVGSDDRAQVTDVSAYPNRAVVWLNSSGARCSGSMLGPSLLLTAGHCLHPGGTDSTADFYDGFRAYPGRDGSSAPFGSCGWERVWTDAEWIESGDISFDYGIVELNCTVGDSTGWFGFRWPQDGPYNGTSAELRGYPGDKRTGTMWTMNGVIEDSLTYRLWYPMDTTGGQSGSPIYNAGNYVIGIHNGGLDPWCDCNYGRLISEGLFRFLQDLK